jgi:metallo-beta-lactamase family protein
MNKSNLEFWGAAGMVTGSNFKLEIPGAGANGGVGTVMVDCGMFQGGPQAHEKNWEKFPYDPTAIDVLIVTHAHIDHIGRIPKLVKAGFAGRIFSTKQTRDIAAFMLEDTAKILAEEARRHNDPEPLYGLSDVARTLSLWETKSYHEPFEPLASIEAEFLDAGHILGSAMVRLTRGAKEGSKRTIIFSGDVGNSPAPIVRDAESVKGAHYLVLDSTYGDRNHESRQETEAKFADVVKSVIAQKGTLLVPVFSLERAHIILYQLNNLVESGEISPLPVFLDSPLAMRLMPIYQASQDLFNEEVQAHLKKDHDIFSFPKLKIVHTNTESAAIEKVSGPKIIIAGSGMSVGGRIPAHEINLLPDPNTTLLITGFQSVGTLGRAILDGQKQVTITGVPVDVEARIESVQGFSAHKDADAMLEFVDAASDTLDRVFVVHGEPKSALFLVQRVRDYLDVDAIAPERGKVYEIDF